MNTDQNYRAGNPHATNLGQTAQIDASTPFPSVKRKNPLATLSALNRWMAGFSSYLTEHQSIFPDLPKTVEARKETIQSILDAAGRVSVRSHKKAIKNNLNNLVDLLLTDQQRLNLYAQLHGFRTFTSTCDPVDKINPWSLFFDLTDDSLSPDLFKGDTIKCVTIGKKAIPAPYTLINVAHWSRDRSYPVCTTGYFSDKADGMLMIEQSDKDYSLSIPLSEVIQVYKVTSSVRTHIVQKEGVVGHE